MTIWKSPMLIEELNTRAQGSMATYLGIEFIEVGENTLTAKMPVAERTLQPYGIMHGGASCVLAETVGSVAANFCVDFEKQYCVGLSIFTNHVKMAYPGWVYATAKPVHLGKSTQVWEVRIHNDKNQLVSFTQLTMAVLNR